MWGTEVEAIRYASHFILLPFVIYTIDCPSCLYETTITRKSIFWANIGIRTILPPTVLYGCFLNHCGMLLNSNNKLGHISALDGNSCIWHRYFSYIGRNFAETRNKKLEIVHHTKTGSNGTKNQNTLFTNFGGFFYGNWVCNNILFHISDVIFS